MPYQQSGGHPTDHISVSQLKMFLRCPLQYEFRYIKGLIVPSNGARTLGKAVHSTLEQNYQQKIETKKDLPLVQWNQIFSDSWELHLPETEFGKKENPGKLKDDGIRLLYAYYRQAAPKIRPVSVEKEFSVSIAGLKIPFVGHIDLIDENRYIIDHKISKSSWAKGHEHTDIQLTGYALAYRRITGKKEEGLRLDIMVRTTTPKIDQRQTSRNREDFRRFRKLLIRVNRAIETGIFYPNANFLCPACGYSDLCKKW